MFNPSKAFAFTTRAFDAEYCLQIVGPGDQVLVTVGQTEGPSRITEFHVWDGEGLNDDGETASPEIVVHVAENDIAAAWKRAVGFAYARAVTAQERYIAGRCDDPESMIVRPVIAPIVAGQTARPRAITRSS